MVNGYIYIDNTSLTTLSGFQSLSIVNGNFGINGSNSMISISSFDALRIVNGNIDIFNVSPILEGFNSLISIGGYLKINSNILTTVSGFNALISIGGYFNIINNSLLTLVSGFSALETITGDFTIVSNSSLTEISGFLALITVSGTSNSVDGNNSSLNICLPTFTAINNAIVGGLPASTPPYTTYPCP